jgi:hypothetical protein
METARTVGEWPSFLRQSPPPAVSGSFVSSMGSYRNFTSTRTAAANTAPLRSPSADDNMRIRSVRMAPSSLAAPVGMAPERESSHLSAGQNNQGFDKLWDFVFREQKDRMESFRELQSQLRQQQDAINSITFKSEKSVDDIWHVELKSVEDTWRKELKTMREECRENARKLYAAEEYQTSYRNRVDDLSQQIQDLRVNSLSQDKAYEDLRDLVTSKLDQENESVNEVREDLRSLKERTTVSIAEVQQFMRELRAHADNNQANEHASDETDAEEKVPDPVDQACPLAKVSHSPCDKDSPERAGAESNDSGEGAEVSNFNKEWTEEQEKFLGELSKVMDPAAEKEHAILADEAEQQDACKENCFGVRSPANSKFVGLVMHTMDDLREGLIKVIEDRMADCHTEGAAQVTDLERRMTEEWTGLRSWVDAAVVAVVNRISSLECTLQSEMAERLSSAQLMSREFAEGAAHNEEQIKKIQGELDKLLFDMKVITVSQTFKRSMSKAGQIPPPAQTPPEEFTNSKVGVAGDTENSTENERQHTSTTPRKTTAATTTAPTMAPTNGGSIRSPTTLEGLSSTTTNASTSVSLGSLTKRMPSMQSPQVLNTGVSAPTTASQDGPMPSPRLLSHAQAPQLAPRLNAYALPTEHLQTVA